MNALADDQLRRLRLLLSHMPSITFGRYTGDTPRDIHQGGIENRHQNERNTRQEIRDSPPHILLTNFAMLEYLLLRPRDAEVFKNHRLQFIVLDEAHTYSGAQGIEIAMLMRRLQQYLKKKPKRLQFVLTSATLGDAEESLSLTSTFARDLTGSDFSPADVLKGEIIDSFSKKLENFPSQEIIRSVAVGKNNFESWTMALEEPPRLSKMLQDAGFDVGDTTKKDSCRILFDLFSKSGILAKIHDHCRKTPSSMETLCDLLGMNPDDITMAGLRWLITMGAYARRAQNSVPLLPTRLHFFARGLSGATVCVNPRCQGNTNHPNTNWSEFYLEDRNTCEHCGSKVLPLSTCVHCGLPVMRVFLSTGKWKTSNPPQFPPQARLLTWAEDLDEQSEEIDEHMSTILCLSCGHYSENQNDVACCDNPIPAVLHVIRSRSTDEGNLEVCPRCGGAKGFYQTVLREFRSAEEAPTVVLAETIIRNLPFNPDDPNKKTLPANGRNLLVFSDSRQRAAFFAPYLEFTAAESAYLGPLELALKRAEKAEQRAVTFEEVAAEYVRGLSEISVAVIRRKDESGEEYFELKPRSQLMNPDRSAIRKEVETILYRDFCKSNKHKNTLQGLGLAALTVEFNDEEKEILSNIVPALFENGNEKGWQLIQAMVEVFIARKAVNFPPYVSTRDISSPGPNAVTFHLSRSGYIDGRQIVRWNPYTAPPKQWKNAVNKSRQLAVLSKVIGLDKEKDAQQLENMLTSLWDFFKGGLLLETEQWPGEYRVDPIRLQLTTKSDWYTCEKCGRITTLGLLSTCSSLSCNGTLKKMSLEDMERRFNSNHYRQRYFLPAMPLKVREHTAQLTNEYGKKYQKEFMEGKINVLSSSTTFEMGVDVGQLKAVLLRNVPPTTSSYIQRAGRAGRRQDGISVAVTYARNIPHDQYHYQRPEEIIIGNISSPYINIGNRPLTQRHCNSCLLGYFFREIAGIDQSTLEHPTIDNFFIQQYGGKSLVLLFVEWYTTPEKRAEMLTYLNFILPKEAELNASEALEHSLASLFSASNSVYHVNVVNYLQRFDNQIRDIESQIASANSKQRISLVIAQHSLKKLKEQFLNQRLIDFLSSCGWLPGYAFPQDVVKLIVRQIDYSDRMRLERDREFGISEYAPGSEVIADGVLLRSGGIWFNSNEPEIRLYTCCPECRNISTYHEAERPSMDCTRCGTRLTGRYSPRYYLKPDGFTTLVEDEIRRPSLSRTKPPRTSEVFLLEGAEEFKEHQLKGISYGIKKGGKLFRANSGYKYGGFYICRKCGRGMESQPLNPRHTTPWGSRCSGSFMKVDLAHEIITDILQLRFRDCQPPAPSLHDRSFWLSFQSAFLNGACDALGISSRDLDGTFHGWTEESSIGELVVYDRVPGGAGHIPRIVNNLDKVLNETLVRVRDCKCPDINASCYACLRNYYNQFYWDELSRKKVIDWLTEILS